MPGPESTLDGKIVNIIEIKTKDLDYFINSWKQVSNFQSFTLGSIEAADCIQQRNLFWWWCFVSFHILLVPLFETGTDSALEVVTNCSYPPASVSQVLRLQKYVTIPSKKSYKSQSMQQILIALFKKLAKSPKL